LEEISKVYKELKLKKEYDNDLRLFEARKISFKLENSPIFSGKVDNPQLINPKDKILLSYTEKPILVFQSDLETFKNFLIKLSSSNFLSNSTSFLGIL
jgi:hypothetical protein